MCAWKGRLSGDSWPRQPTSIRGGGTRQLLAARPALIPRSCRLFFPSLAPPRSPRFGQPTWAKVNEPGRGCPVITRRARDRGQLFARRWTVRVVRRENVNYRVVKAWTTQPYCLRFHDGLPGVQHSVDGLHALQWKWVRDFFAFFLPFNCLKRAQRAWK